MYGGAKGGGKSDWLLFDFIEPDLIANPNYRGIILRRTFPRLREIIDRSLKWFHGIGSFSKGEKCWTFPSGAKLFFGHCQYEESKYEYQGHEYQYMGFDQIEEFTESQYAFLKVQCRTSFPDIPVRIRNTANPGNVGHLWVKTKFIDEKIPYKVYEDEFGLTSMFIPAKVYDNLSLMENDPMYVRRLEALPEQERKALLDGDWNIFAGQYFKGWRKDVHEVEPYYIPDYWKRFISGDYGLKKPSSVGWYAIKPDGGGIVRYREIYKEGYMYDGLAKKICEMTPDNERIEYAVFDPAIFGDKQHHSEAREGKSGAEIMQAEINRYYEDDRNKTFQITRADNRRLEGWRTLQKLIKVPEVGVPLFTVFNTCTGFIKTFPANVHDKIRVEDLDTKGEDHSADEGRYAAMSGPPETELILTKNTHPNSPRAFADKMKTKTEYMR